MQTIEFTTAPVIVIESKQSLENILKFIMGDKFKTDTNYRKFEKLSEVSGYSIPKTHLYTGDKVYVFNETTLELVFVKEYKRKYMLLSLQLIDGLSSNFDIEIKKILDANPTI